MLGKIGIMLVFGYGSESFEARRKCLKVVSSKLTVRLGYM